MRPREAHLLVVVDVEEVRVQQGLNNAGDYGGGLE